MVPDGEPSLAPTMRASAWQPDGIASTTPRELRAPFDEDATGCYPKTALP
jgi:hypothetical protein